MKFARLSGLVFICFIFLIISPPDLQGQEVVKKLTLKDAIEIAKKQSPDALMAKHKFRASYWQYRSFQASYLPSLLLTGALPSFNKSIDKISTTEGDVFSRHQPLTAFMPVYH